jgi:molybdate transport system substrate-binding protein
MMTAMVVLGVLAGGCRYPTPAREREREPLRVAAASDLREALPVLARRFTELRGVEVVPTFGASGLLARQIEAGAPFALFLAANRKFVDDLAEAGFVREESVATYARGTLVLALHAGTAGEVSSLADLKKPEVRKIALANPVTAPYGTAGRQVLERAGLWGEVESKVVQAESVRQALQFVESGNAEAGFVGSASARASEVRVVALDPALHDPILQGMGIVASRAGGPAQDEDAGAFAAFVLGAEGQRILAGFGFKAP